jgi:hypothetical protein
MDFNATIDLIIRELDEAREIINDLKKFPGAPMLEIELARAKCRNAAEVIALLKDFREQEASKEKPAEIQSVIFEKKNTGPEKTSEVFTEKAEIKRPSEEIREEMTEKPHVQEKAKTEKLHEDATPHEDATEASEEVRHPHEKTGTPEKETPENQPKKPYVAPIVADTFSHLANRFNEQMGGERDEDFSFMKKKHWSDLSHEIGINDQFYFIREIFNGNRSSYHEAVSKLEQAENVKDARNIIMSYKTDKTENEAVKQLLNLVKRKFSSNE